MTRFKYTIRNNHMHSIVLIFAGSFCLGLIAFSFQLIIAPISDVPSEQELQSIIGISIAILSSFGLLLTILYYFLNLRFYRNKDWGGLVIEGNKLSFRYFNNWRFIEKSIDLCLVESAFVHTFKGQAAIQVTTLKPIHQVEIPCKHLSNEDLTQLLLALKSKQI